MQHKVQKKTSEIVSDVENIAFNCNFDDYAVRARLVAYFTTTTLRAGAVPTCII